MEELEESVPQSTRFTIGYYEGQTKRWICNDDDLIVLYEVYAKCPRKEILLWCEGRKRELDLDAGNTPGNTPKRKKTSGRARTRREEKEERIAMMAEELQEIHEDNKFGFNELQYRLWARMIVHENHDSKEVPPQVPLLQGLPQKKAKSNPFEETMMTTATAVMKAITNNQDQGVVRSTQIQNITDHGISPGKAVDIRSRSLDQLATLKQLYIDGVLTEVEFSEQKDIILSGLKKLN